MSHHRDSIHGAAPEFIVLLRQLVILILRPVNDVLEPGYLAEVSLDRLLNLVL